VFDHVLKKALSAAKKSKARTFKHAAVVFDQRGRILAVGINCPHVECDCASYYHQFGRYHSETLACLRAFGYHPRKGLETVFILSIRLNKHGQLRNAKPCPECMNVISHHRIQYVYYSTNEGTIKRDYIPY
jgi:tRNA(Arg) A34 adenosine deaminase TadA